jgi:peroxiredoxin
MSPALRNLTLGTIAVAALAAGFFASRLTGTHRPDTKPGPTLSQITLQDADGKSRNLGEWTGKVIVLNFWATWCPPCREEIPLFQSAQQHLGPQGLQILGLAIDQPEAVRTYRKNNHVSYPLLVDDAAFKLMDIYGNTSGALPFTVVLDRSGQIVTRRIGAYRGQELENLVLPLLTDAN